MIRTFAFVLLCVTPVAGTAQTAPSGDALTSRLFAMSDTFMKTWQKGDTAALAASLAPDFTYVGPEGIASKEGVLTGLSHCKLSDYSLGRPKVLHTSEESVVLIYTVHQSAACDGHPLPTDMLNTDTFVRRSGKWLFAMTTATVAGQQP